MESVLLHAAVHCKRYVYVRTPRVCALKLLHAMNNARSACALIPAHSRCHQAGHAVRSCFKFALLKIYAAQAQLFAPQVNKNGQRRAGEHGEGREVVAICLQPAFHNRLLLEGQRR